MPILANCLAIGLETGCCDAGRGAGDSPGIDIDGGDIVAQGLVADEGFGSAVALSGGRTWVGAPHAGGGRVYEVVAGSPVVVAEGGERLGSVLAPLPEGETPFVAGDPLRDGGGGAVVGEGGATLATGDASLGLAVAGGSTWAAAHGSGWTTGDGRSGPVDGRPSALVLAPDLVAIGMATGETAFVAGDSAWPRPDQGDEAGFALARGDVDGDGAAEWVVGAPGADRVYVVGADDLALEATIEGGPGRFGASVAVADIDGDGVDDLLAGAPMAGAGVEGAAFLYTRGDLGAPAADWTGEDEGEQLGFAVAAEPGRVGLGAPGAAGEPGRVTIALVPPTSGDSRRSPARR